MSKILDVSAEEQINLQKDLLFIESGEDVEDIFLSFKYYKLEWNIWQLKKDYVLLLIYMRETVKSARIQTFTRGNNDLQKFFTPLLMY